MLVFKLLQYVIFVVIGMYLIKIVFKFLKINVKDDLTPKKIWIGTFLSTVIFILIFIALTFIISVLLINFK